MLRMHKQILLLALLGAVFVPSLSQTSTSTSTSTATGSPSTSTRNSPTSVSTQTTKRPTTPTGTTLSPAEECAKHNGSCKDCVDAPGAKCLYCYEDDSCQLYPSSKVLPPSDMCSLSEARWGVCWLNFEALIISVSVIGGVIILTITFCCIYCCCCRGKGRKKYEREDARYEQQKMERKVKQDERRNERKGRLDEIRRKYGLVKDDAPYQRFDA